MIPSIVTPPTDNLYKFISLFGLAIFLFSIYNLGVVYDQSTDNKTQIEGFKVEVQRKLYEKSSSINSSLSADHEKFHPSKLRKLGKELNSIESIIERSDLTPMEVFEFKGRISQLKVGLDSLYTKKAYCISIALLGVLVMVYGFLRWKRKEQDIRDKILEIEHIIKQNERDKKGKSKKKKNKANEIIAAAAKNDFENN